jgi:hypothetical protein
MILYVFNRRTALIQTPNINGSTVGYLYSKTFSKTAKISYLSIVESKLWPGARVTIRGGGLGTNYFDLYFNTSTPHGGYNYTVTAYSNNAPKLNRSYLVMIFLFFVAMYYSMM